MKKREIISVLLLVIVFAIAAYKHYHKLYHFEKDGFLMDTILSVQIDTKAKNGEALLDSLFAYIQKWDSDLSYYKKGSELEKINASEKIEISDPIKEMLAAGKKISAQSDSLYDLAIGTLVDIWDFNKAEIPSKSRIDSAMQYIGFDKVKVVGDSLIKNKHTKINLGSIAKGYIVDKAVSWLKSQGAEKGIVNAGGDIKIFGYNKAIKIGIQHPRKENGQIVGILKVKNKAVITSGDYERYFMKNGKRYHHIINPKTGYPSDKSISVTVISEKAYIADAYSTALFLLTPDKAKKLADSIPNLDAIIFYIKNGKIFYKKSVGMDKYLLKISDNNVKEEK